MFLAVYVALFEREILCGGRLPLTSKAFHGPARRRAGAHHIFNISQLGRAQPNFQVCRPDPAQPMTLPARPATSPHYEGLGVPY